MVQITATALSLVPSPHRAGSVGEPVRDTASLRSGNDAPRSEQPRRIYPESPSARQKFSDVHQRPAIVNALLKHVHDDTKQLAPNAYTKLGGAAPNDSGVPCIEATMVSIPMRDKQNLSAHAAHINQINFSPDAETPNRTSLYRKGQSPAGPLASAPQSTTATKLSSACEKALVEGIDSGLGLYQFVSRRAHYRPHESREMPIIGAISKLWLDRKEGEPIILGGRYEVTDFQKQSDFPRDRLHCLLTVRDLQNPDNTRIVPLTQAGLQFTGRLLKVREIETANAILDAHRALTTAQLPAASRQAEPTVYSYAGIGRNATLITYRRMTTLIADGKIHNETTLANELREAIRIGRTACGKRFLHSNAQINELWTSLLRTLSKTAEGKNSGRSSVSREPVVTASTIEPEALHLDREFPARSAAPDAGVSTIEPSTKFANWTAADTSIESKADPATDQMEAPIVVPAAGEFASALPTARSINSANLTFDNLESADNEFHKNWNIACKLLKASNNERGRRFENAFGAGKNRTVIRHLSKRQLSAVLAQLGVPNSGQGYIENRLIENNLNESERAVVRTLPKFTPDNTEYALAKVERQVAIDEGTPEHQAAVQLALYGTGAERDRRELPFIGRTFFRWENPGHGDCLFHSLHSEGPGSYLQEDSLNAIREQTALIRLRTADEAENSTGNNWQQMTFSLDYSGLLEAFDENGIPYELSNAQFAEIQRRPHVFSGDLEIAQWLAIPGNSTKSVMLVDSHPARIGLVSFRIDENRQVIRKPISIDELCEGENLTPEDVHMKISEKIKDAMDHFRSREHLAIHRTELHFVRIVGLRPLEECQWIWGES